ncbi:MAG: SDR family oxidoreductase [Muribaculaceae bacterium]|nr:SDR family oxidoreductase [Muribaculaceae bacterium]
MRRFKDKTVVVTGGAQGIGARTAQRFREEGAKVEIIDLQPGDWFVGDIADPQVLERFAEYVIGKHGAVDVLVNNALPPMVGIDDCSWEEFVYAQKVGVAAPFYLSKLFKNNFAEGASIINISSTRATMSQPQTESYTAAKGGISALTHSLAVSLVPKVRVNSISPGWINTTDEVFDGPDASQQLVGRVGRPDDIASMILFLASDESGFITGENIVIDGGMTRQMIYHNDHGWKLEN